MILKCRDGKLSAFPLRKHLHAMEVLPTHWPDSEPCGAYGSPVPVTNTTFRSPSSTREIVCVCELVNE